MRTVVFGILVLVCHQHVAAEVLKSEKDGFLIEIKQATIAEPAECFRIFVEDFGKWWDPSHSYSRNPASMSLDLKRMAMFEKLPNNGFVRHMEIVFYQPDKMLRLSGGLGPLQPKGVSGALTFEFQKTDQGCEVLVSYNVSGSSLQALDKIAKPVDAVLSRQLKRFAERCVKVASDSDQKK